MKSLFKNYLPLYQVVIFCAACSKSNVVDESELAVISDLNPTIENRVAFREITFDHKMIDINSQADISIALEERQLHPIEEIAEFKWRNITQKF